MALHRVDADRQDVPCRGAEHVDERGIEVPAAAAAGDLDGPFGTVDAVVDLDDIREMEQSHGEGDVLTTHPARHTPAVPPGEPLPQRITNLRTQPEPLRQGRGRQAVRHQPAPDPLAAGADESGGEAEAVECGASRAGVAEHEAEPRQPHELHVVAVAAEGDVVTEPGRDLWGVRDAADPGKDPDVEQVGPFLVGQADSVRQPGSDAPGPQHVLHRLAEAQIRRERERGEQVRKAETCVVALRLHTRSVEGSTTRGGPMFERRELVASGQYARSPRSSITIVEANRAK